MATTFFRTVRELVGGSYTCILAMTRH